MTSPVPPEPNDLTPEPTADPAPRATPRTTTPTPIIGLACLLLMMAGTTWPFVVAVLSPVLRAELGFSASALGVAYGVYYFSGSLCSSVAGRLVDRGGFRVAGAVLLAVSVTQHLILASARGWVQLAVSGAVGGLSLALVNPVTNTLIGTLLHGRAARNVVGVKQTGVPLSAVFAGIVAPLSAAAVGWRASVLATLAISALAALLLFAVRGRDGAASSGASRPRLGHRFGLERFVLGMGIVASGINGYLVLFIVDVFDGSVQRAGALAATLALSGAVGRILWATLGGGGRTLPILRSLGIVGGTGLIAFSLVGVEVGIWVAAVGMGLSIQAWQGLGMVAVIESGTSGTIGAASARVMRDFYIGFVIGAPLTGLIIDNIGFRTAWASLAVIALLAALSLRQPDPVATPA